MSQEDGAMFFERNLPSKLTVIEQATQGKTPERNEDAYAFDETRIVLSDGATDKNGFRHEGKTGGELASAAVVDVCMHSDSYGRALVDKATAAIRAQYEQFNPSALDSSAHRYSATLVDARLMNDTEGASRLVVTIVGDSGIRITKKDGTTELFYSTKLIDRENGELRAAYIREHPEDIEGGRAVIMDRLKNQHASQNIPTAQDPYGHGFIDGSYVPDEFIQVHTFPATDISAIEVFSDGYAVVPPESSLEAFERTLALQKQVDPNRIGLGGYPAQTKTNDDRTYLRATLGDSSAL